MTGIPAYSSATETSYDNWDALLEAEANGFVMVAVITNTHNGRTWPWVVGPFDSRKDAENYRTRTRTKWKRDQDKRGLYVHLSYRFYVRPAWKVDARRAGG